MVRKKILVSGCPRSGTGYAAKLFKSYGLDIGHEQVGDDGVSSWCHITAGDLPWVGKFDAYKYDCLIHQVRNPIHAISSMTTLRDESFKFLFDKLEISEKYDDKLHASMLVWYFWNIFIEAHAPDARVQAENLDEWVTSNATFLGISVGDKPDGMVSQLTNARAHKIYAWSDMEAKDSALACRIKRLAELYGYPTEDKEIKLSAIMIMRDEADNLDRCLSSVAGLVDEIVIIDTGSTDNSIEIAERYGAIVTKDVWQNDFSHHRNQSVAAATGDWVIQVDCDEEIFCDDPENFKKTLSLMPDYVGGLSCTFEDMEGDDVCLRFNNLRIFRKDNVYYKNIVHNEPMITGACLYSPLITYRHYGYDIPAEKMALKHERTINLLKKRLDDCPEDYNCHFYLMQSLGCIGDFDQAIDHGKKYFAVIDTVESPNYSVFYPLAQLYIGCGEYEAAEMVISKALSLIPDDLDIAQVLMEFGAATKQPNLILQGSRKFIKNFNEYKNNPTIARNRFVYNFKNKKLAYALFNVVLNGFHEALAANDQWQQIPADEIDEKLKKAMDEELKKIGVDINV